MSQKGIVESCKHSFVHPCYTSILRTISTPEEKFVFLKHLFSIAIDDEQKDKIRIIADDLEILLSRNYDINLRVCPYEIEYLMDEFYYYKKYAISSDCISYFAKFKKDANTCYACTRSPLYSNKYRDYELMVLHRMVSSSEKCTEVIKSIVSADIEFLSVYEVIADNESQNTLFLNINQFIFNIYQKHGPALFTVSKESVEKTKALLFDYFFDEIIDFLPKKREPDNEQIKVILNDALNLIHNSSSATPADMSSFCNEYRQWQISRTENITRATDESDSQKPSTHIPTCGRHKPKYKSPSS